MTVKKFVQSDYTAETTDQAGFEAYCGDIEPALAVLAEQLNQFAPYASTPPDMKVNVMAGRIASALGIASDAAFGGSTEAAVDVLVVAAQQTATITAPTTYPRIDCVGLDIIAGTLKVVTGDEAEVPVAPAFPDYVFPLCSVSLAVGQAVITNGHITDLRWCPTINDSPAGGTLGIAAEYSSSVCYELFSAAGTYNFVKPSGARFYRLTLVGASSGSGGLWYNAAYTSYASGGGSGVGATLPNILIAAEDLTIVVGVAGALGLASTGGADNATDGGNGTATTVTGVTTGLVLTAAFGAKGLRGRITPAGGAGGAGGAAPTGGFAGGNGTAGGIGGPNVAPGGSGGQVGEQGQLVKTYVAAGGGWGGMPGIWPGGGAQGGAGAPQPNGAGGADGMVLVEWF